MLRSLWKVLLCACILPFAIYLPIILIDSGSGELFYWLVLLLLFLGMPWTLAWTNVWKVGLVTLAAGIISVAVSFALLAKSHDVRTQIRWAVCSKTYKQEVLKQHSSSVELQHIDWDSWGWGGNNIYVYLVYDPKDHFGEAIQDSAGVKAERLPCEVSRIQRLEKHWYTVIFYSGEEWTNC